MPIHADETAWFGWQFDRPDLGQGYALYFRRGKSPYIGLNARLRALDPTAKYEAIFKETYEVKQKWIMTGAELAGMPVMIDTAPSSVLIQYRKLSLNLGQH